MLLLSFSSLVLFLLGYFGLKFRFLRLSLLDFIWLCWVQRISLLRPFSPDSVMWHMGSLQLSALCSQVIGVIDIQWGEEGWGGWGNEGLIKRAGIFSDLLLPLPWKPLQFLLLLLLFYFLWPMRSAFWFKFRACQEGHQAVCFPTEAPHGLSWSREDPDEILRTCWHGWVWEVCWRKQRSISRGYQALQVP